MPVKKSIFVAMLLCFSIILGQNYFPQSARGAQNCSAGKSARGSVFLPDKANIVHSFDVLNYKIYLDNYACYLSPYPKSFTANVVITLKADSSINFINLNAVNTSLQIASVGLAGASYTHSNNILRVNLDRTYSSGETLDVKINYSHLNVSDGAVNVSGGFFFTDCEPEGARKWFPCWDKPSDKATLDLTARVPASVKLGSNGRLADSTKTGDTIYYHWISRDPVATYLIVVASKVNYNLDVLYWKKISNPLDSIPFRFYYNSGENPTAMENIIRPLADFYSTKFCEHPFEKNGFATLNNQFTWGGMENQTLTTLCPGCWDEGYVAHEFAHQWFGDMITCATWADITLNEGWATFCEALWIEKKSGYTAYKTEISGDASSYLSGNPGWAIYNPDWAVNTPNSNTLFNFAITYAKGACVLHQLRFVMGDDLFFQAVRTYVNRPDLKYRSAVLDDFKEIMSQAYGSDLTWFFDGWYKQPNHPVYANKYFIQQTGTGTWTVGFIANQTQTNSAFHKMILPIKISFSNGTDTTLRVFNTYNAQQFNFNFTKQPTAVAFDPNIDIVLKTATLSTVSAGPVLSSPQNNSGNQPQSLMLSWNAYSGASSYRLQIATDENFSNLVLEDSTLSTPAKTVGPLTNQMRYFWRVNAKVVTSVTPWSATWSFTVGGYCKDLSLLGAWNMVAVPYQAASMNVSALFPMANSPAYGYNNNYFQTTQLVNSAGYWIRYPSATTVSICGNPLSSNSIQINSGWNLIGVYHNDVDVSQITTVPTNILTSAFYSYSSGYNQSSVLYSGKGYWIRASQAGTIFLPVSGLKASTSVKSLPSDFGKIMISDADGNNSNLYLSPNSADYNSAYDLPPVPPSGVFDVRYRGDRQLESTDGMHQIELHSCSYPVKISAIKTTVKITDALGGRLLNTILKDGQSVSIDNPGVSTINVEAVQIPMEYSLSQNYPNPFNPSTRISFEIPEQTHVTLKIYDVLGNEIMKLVNEIRPAGHYEETLNAGMLSSGVYLYELKAGSFHQMKKLMLLR